MRHALFRPRCARPSLSRGRGGDRPRRGEAQGHAQFAHFVFEPIARMVCLRGSGAPAVGWPPCRHWPRLRLMACAGSSRCRFLALAHAPQLTQALRAARQASGNPMIYRLGLHAKKPPIEEQLPLLRTLWPGPLVCRWNLHRRHGAYGYESAKAQYAPFDSRKTPTPPPAPTSPASSPAPAAQSKTLT